MTLRASLGLAVVAIAVPLWLVVALVVDDLERHGLLDQLRDFATQRMENGGRERCERAPVRFGGPPAPRAETPLRGPRAEARQRMARARLRTELWAYGADLRSANPNAPTLPAALVESFQAGADNAMVEQPSADGARTETFLLARMAWWPEGPCAAVLVRDIRRPDPPAPLRPHWAGAVVIGIALLATLLALAPIARRVRRLTQDVRRAADLGYREPIAVRGGDEIAALGHAFNDVIGEVRTQVDALAARERTLRSFVGDTMHDVMVPLTVLQGHLASLRLGPVSGAPVDPTALAAAMDECQHIASILHNLAALAKLETGGLVWRDEPIELGPLVERVVARHRTVAGLRDVQLDFATPEEPLWVRGDVTLLEQAVGNVVHNAIRHGRPGGHAAVVLGGDGDEFVLRVVDDGPGIPDAELPHVFERRYRGQAARTRDPDGTGLGLHIAHQVAERLGLRLALRRSEFGGVAAEFRGPLVARRD